MRPGRQRVRGLMAVVATVSVAVGMGLAPTAANASGSARAGAGSPKIVVTPSTGLVSGQVVNVKGSGFAKNQEIGGVACPRGASDPTTCDIDNIAVAQSDAHGNFTTTFVMHRTLLTFDGLSDCAPAACELLFAGDDFNVAGTAPVTFNAGVGLPPTSVKVAPATDLADRQSVKVSAKGFTADPFVDVLECVAGTFSCGPTDEGMAAANGNFTTKFAVRRELVDMTGTQVDCAAAPGTCEILAIDFADVDYHTTTPLDFDPSLPPPPPPKLTVKPSKNLPYYARVSISGKGFDPNDFVFLLECATTKPGCAFIDSFEQTDSHGVLSGQPMLQREITDELDPDAPPIDCAAPHEQCVLTAQGGTGDSEVSVPLTFDPHAPIPPAPTATVSPSGPYHDQQTVNITGKNFAPNAQFTVSECSNSEDESFCEGSSDGTLTSATGSLSMQFQLQRSFEDPEAPTVTCSKKVPCTLEISSEGGAVVDVPLTFTGGSSATAVRPHGRVTRTPNRSGLRWAALAPASCVAAPSARAATAPSLRLAAACATLRRAAARG